MLRGRRSRTRRQSLPIPGDLPSSGADLFGKQVTCRLSVVPRRIQAGHLLSTWPRLLHWAGYLPLNERHGSPRAAHLHCWIGSHHSRAGELPVPVTARTHGASDLRARRSRADGENRTCLGPFWETAFAHRPRGRYPPRVASGAQARGFGAHARGVGRSRAWLRALRRAAWRAVSRARRCRGCA